MFGVKVTMFTLFTVSVLLSHFCCFEGTKGATLESSFLFLLWSAEMLMSLPEVDVDCKDWGKSGEEMDVKSILWWMAETDSEIVPRIRSCCTDASCSFRMEEMRNLRLNFSALTDGKRFGSAATNVVSKMPPLLVSMTAQMSRMSLTSFCSTFGRIRDFLKSLMWLERLTLSHSEMRRFLAIVSSSLA